MYNVDIMRRPTFRTEERREGLSRTSRLCVGVRFPVESVAFMFFFFSISRFVYKIRQRRCHNASITFKCWWPIVYGSSVPPERWSCKITCSLKVGCFVNATKSGGKKVFGSPSGRSLGVVPLLHSLGAVPRTSFFQSLCLVFGCCKDRRDFKMVRVLRELHDLTFNSQSIHKKGIHVNLTSLAQHEQEYTGYVLRIPQLSCQDAACYGQGAMIRENSRSLWTGIPGH